MTPTHLGECLVALGWTNSGLARKLGRPEATVRQWRRGVVTIPEAEAVWIDGLARFHQAHPAPQRS